MTVSESLSRKVSVIQTSLAPRVGGTFGGPGGAPTPGRGQINAKSEKIPSFGSSKFQASNLGLSLLYSFVLV